MSTDNIKVTLLIPGLWRIPIEMNRKVLVQLLCMRSRLSKQDWRKLKVAQVDIEIDLEVFQMLCRQHLDLNLGPGVFPTLAAARNAIKDAAVSQEVPSEEITKINSHGDGLTESCYTRMRLLMEAGGVSPDNVILICPN